MRTMPMTSSTGIGGIKDNLKKKFTERTKQLQNIKIRGSKDNLKKNNITERVTE